MEHVPPELFGEDYLYFYDDVVSDDVTDAEVDGLWRLLALEPGVEVLDVPCGHGRIANRLAARGARVTGLDADPVFLERARADAAMRGVDVDYLEGDMRELPWRGRFDLVVNWFTSFGYFGDDADRAWLREARKTLRSGGRLVLEMNNRDALARRWLPATVVEREGDLQVDRQRFDALTGRNHTERFHVRGGRVRRVDFSVRLFAFTEIRDWLLHAGFSSVAVSGRDAEPLTLETRRMVVVATR